MIPGTIWEFIWRFPEKGWVPPNHPAVGVPPAVGNLPGGGRWMLDEIL